LISLLISSIDKGFGMTPARRWPIWPFVPAAIVVGILAPVAWSSTAIEFIVRELLDGKLYRLWQLAVPIIGSSLLMLLYGFVRSLPNERPNRRWRIRPFIAAGVMVVVIPSLFWTGSMIEIAISNDMNYEIGLWQLASGILGGSLITLIYGLPHSLLVTTVIVGGNRILIHGRLDSVWPSLLLGAPLALIVLGILPVEWSMWPYLAIAGSGASALHWWIVVRPLRMRRLVHGAPPQPLPT
jgi:hypothetical protein